MSMTRPLSHRAYMVLAALNLRPEASTRQLTTALPGTSVRQLGALMETLYARRLVERRQEQGPSGLQNVWSLSRRTVAR